MSKQKNFTMIPNNIARSGNVISSTAFRVYAVLTSLRHLKHSKTSDTVFPSLNSLRRMTGVSSHSTLQRALKELHDLNLIRKHSTANRPNKYQLLSEQYIQEHEGNWIFEDQFLEIVEERKNKFTDSLVGQFSGDLLRKKWTTPLRKQKCTTTDSVKADRSKVYTRNTHENDLVNTDRERRVPSDGEITAGDVHSAQPPFSKSSGTETTKYGPRFTRRYSSNGGEQT